MAKMLLGVSSCLLGQNVRYDGKNKGNSLITDTLNQWFDFHPVCPETECGLPVPREPMRLEGSPQSPRLMTVISRRDLTEPMQDWIKKRIKDLTALDLCGFIFKSKSPSSGLRNINIYSRDGQIINKNGRGLFAGVFCLAFPEIPVEDEERLTDPESGWDFIERILILRRWKEVRKITGSHSLEVFHRNHKYLFMARSPDILREMGQIVARSGKKGKSPILEEYSNALLSLLAKKATVEKNINALQHVAGYFKKNMTAQEKEAFKNELEQYRNRMIPLSKPLSVLQGLTEKWEQPYLLSQHFLTPHPAQFFLEKNKQN